MAEKISNFLKGQIVTSIIYIILGICFIFMPVASMTIICKFIFGILLIAVGIYHIVTYVAEKLSATILDLFCGGVLLVFGIFLFSYPQIIIKLLPTLLGTFILADSIWTLKGALRLRARTQRTWQFVLIASLVFIGLGIALIVNPFEAAKVTMIFAGWVFLCNGVIDLVNLILLRKGLKELEQDLTAVDSEGKIIEDEAKSENETAEDAAKPEYAAWGSRPSKTIETSNSEQNTDQTAAEAAPDTAADAKDPAEDSGASADS